MSKTKTRQMEDSLNEELLSVALELGERHWKVAIGHALGGERLLKQLRAGDGQRLRSILQEQRDVFGLSEGARIVSCYGAGREGFRLDRFLRAHGIENRIVDSASIEISRQARRARIDRLDAEKLLTMLQRDFLGEERVSSIVRVSMIEAKNARSWHREYRTLVIHSTDDRHPLYHRTSRACMIFERKKVLPDSNSRSTTFGCDSLVTSTIATRNSRARADGRAVRDRSPPGQN